MPLVTLDRFALVAFAKPTYAHPVMLLFGFQRTGEAKIEHLAYHSGRIESKGDSRQGHRVKSSQCEVYMVRFTQCPGYSSMLPLCCLGEHLATLFSLVKYQRI